MMSSAAIEKKVKMDRKIEEGIAELLALWEADDNRDGRKHIHDFGGALSRRSMDRIIKMPEDWVDRLEVVVSALVKDTKTKTSLCFTNFPHEITDEFQGLLRVIRGKQNLNTLEFTQDRFPWSSISTFSLEKLFAAIHANPNIKTINFNYMNKFNLSDEQIHVIAQAIKTNPNLNEMILQVNLENLSDKAFKELISSIYENPNIKTFNLYSYSNLSEDRQKIVLEQFKKNTSITHIYKPAPGARIDEAQVLFVISKGFTDSNFRQFFELLRRNKRQKGVDDLIASLENVEVLKMRYERKEREERKASQDRPSSASSSSQAFHPEKPQSDKAITPQFISSKGGFVMAAAVGASIAMGIMHLLKKRS